MNDDTNRGTDQQADISKSQSAQQPQGQDQTGQARSDQLNPDATSQSPDQSNMADYGSAEQADAMTQNRSGVEQSAASDQSGQQSGGFVGSESQHDTSSELIDSEQSEPPAGK